MPISKERLAEIDAIPDAKIDTSDIPERDETFFAAARSDMPANASLRAASSIVDEHVFE